MAATASDVSEVIVSKEGATSVSAIAAILLARWPVSDPVTRLRPVVNGAGAIFIGVAFAVRNNVGLLVSAGSIPKAVVTTVAFPIISDGLPVADASSYTMAIVACTAISLVLRLGG